jgi:hypothetical protein
MSEHADAVIDSLCNRALEVVAKRGWLATEAWSVLKAVHAFAKPIRVVLAAETPDDVVQQLLLRSVIVAVHLNDNIDAPNPLPAGLQELIVSLNFCGIVAELPDTLCSFEATVADIFGNKAVQWSLLERLPNRLQRLRVNKSCSSYNWKSGRMAADFPALPCLTALCLQGLEWSTGLPTRLQELSLERCKVSAELQLPLSLRKLVLVYCESNSSSGSDSDSDGSIRVCLNEVLQHVVIKSETECSIEFNSELPSTLTHLVLHDESSASLGALPPGLQHLDFNIGIAEPLSVLPSTLQVLKLGYSYNYPLGILPDTLTVLGILPQCLRSLCIDSNLFEHNLGPLPLHLEHLHLGETT